jgi:hypothetical protein
MSANFVCSKFWITVVGGHCDHPFIRKLLPQYADSILAYAAKHDYPDILNIAASFVLEMPLREVVVALPANLVIPWVTTAYISSDEYISNVVV